MNIPRLNNVTVHLMYLTALVVVLVAKGVVYNFHPVSNHDEVTVRLGATFSQLIIWVMAYRMALRCEHKWLIGGLGLFITLTGTLIVPILGWMGIIGLFLFYRKQPKQESVPKKKDHRKERALQAKIDKAKKQAAQSSKVSKSSAPDEKEIEYAQLINDIPRLSEQHVKSCRDLFKIDLDYSAESITKLEDIIVLGWSESPQMLEEVSVSFGSYLGETVRKVHGGEWGFSKEEGVYLQHIGRNGDYKGAKIFPFGKTKKRFQKGRNESLASYYKTLLYVLENKM